MDTLDILKRMPDTLVKLAEEERKELEDAIADVSKLLGEIPEMRTRRLVETSGRDVW